MNALSALWGGGQTYLFNLFAHLPEDPSLRIIVIAPPGLDNKFAQSGADIFTPRFAGRSVIHRTVWEAWSLPRLLRSLSADVLYCPGGILIGPSGAGWKTAVAFRNMLPFDDSQRRRYPIGYMRFRLWLLSHLMIRSFRRADLLIFISDYAREVIERYIPKRQGRDLTIPHGIQEPFLKSQPAVRTDVMPEQYVLYVSNFDTYKRQIEVVDAWYRLTIRRPTVEKLVLVGKDNTPYGRRLKKHIHDLGLQKDVIVAGNVLYKELPGWYRHATVNLFASSCENCPHILLEALGAGRPVLASNIRPMPDIAGEAAEYFDPSDPDSLAELLTKVLDHAEQRNEMGRKALKRARNYNAIESASRTWHALIELAEA